MIPPQHKSQISSNDSTATKLGKHFQKLLITVYLAYIIALKLQVLNKLNLYYLLYLIIFVGYRWKFSQICPVFPRDIIFKQGLKI